MAKSGTIGSKKKPTLQEAAGQDSQSSADHTIGSKMAAAGAIGSTTILEVLIFSGDKETKEYEGMKHI
jgi:hypothetical protein